MADELIGRHDDIALIRAARTRAAHGVLVTGAPGVGRTSVFDAMVAEWRSHRDDVLLVRPAAPERSLRFAALTSVLPADAAAPITFDAVAEALVRRVVASPVGSFVLAIDDVQLVDEASLCVIADVLGRDDVFVLATVDDGAVGRDPLSARLFDGGLVEVRLGPLTAPAVGELAARWLGSPVDAAEWHARSQGNPTAILAAIGDLTGDPRRTPDPAATSYAAALVALSAPARKLLAVMAVAETIPVGVAVAIAGRGALDELLEERIVALSADGGAPRDPSNDRERSERLDVRFRHPAHGPQVRGRLGALEARSARRAALVALRDEWRELPPHGRLRLASLAVDAGVPLREQEVAEVAELARLSGDARLALRLAREAADRLDRFEDHRRLADVAHEQGEVIDLLFALERMGATAGSPSDRAVTAIAESQHLLWRGGDVDGALRALGRNDVSAEPEVVAVRARLLATVGRTADGIETARPLVGHHLPRVRMQAATGLAHGLRLAGRPSDAVAVLDRAIEAATAVLDPVLSVSRQVLSVGQVLALLEAGRWRDASALAVRVVSYAQRYDEVPGRAIALLVHGLTMVESGSPGPAIGTLGSAAELFESLRQPAGIRWSLSARALAHGMCDHADDARDDVERLHRMPAHPSNLLPSLEPRARAWAMVAAAEPEAARSTLTDAIARLREAGLVGAAWQCAHDLLSLDRPAALLDLEIVDGEPIAELRRRHARACQSRDVDELAALAVAYDEAGGIRWAAECSAAVARLAARSGSTRAERRASAQLTSFTERCIGLDIPALSIGAVAKLSVREREIASLAARGLTSRAIGDRLGLSMRTVDNHLARCFDKLGARNRAELTELLDG